MCFGDVREAQNIRRQLPRFATAYSCTNQRRLDFIVVLAAMEIGLTQLPIDWALLLLRSVERWERPYIVD